MDCMTLTLGPNELNLHFPDAQTSGPQIESHRLLPEVGGEL